jgi:hypothetical protein
MGWLWDTCADNGMVGLDLYGSKDTGLDIPYYMV